MGKLTINISKKKIIITICHRKSEENYRDDYIGRTLTAAYH